MEKKNVIIPLLVPRERSSIRLACWDCHAQGRPSILANLNSAGPKNMKGAQATAENHTPKGHHIFFIVGRKQK